MAGGKPGRLSAARSIIWARPANPTGLSAPRWGLGQVSSVQLCRFMRRALIGLPAAFLPRTVILAPQGAYQAVTERAWDLALAPLKESDL